MKIIDLTSNYIHHVCEQNDFDSYEKTCPELFEHYYKFWSQRKHTNIFDKSDIQSSHKMILSLIPKIENKFLSHNIDIHNLTLIIFVGMGNTNGHAFKYQNQFVVWIPVETYKNKIDSEVFITHEIAHALHYTNSNTFYFFNQNEQKQIGRQLITEGLATYFSKIILNITDEKALWGNYLETSRLETWMISCEKQFEAIKTIVKNNFYSANNQLGLFYANDEKDILNFRAGYFAGLKLVEQIVEINRLTPIDLLQMSKNRFEKFILSLL